MPATRLVPALRTGAAWLVAGAVAGAFAVAFRAADQALFTHAYGRSDVVSAFTALPLVARLLIPAAGGAVAAALAARVRDASGTGQIIAAVSAGRRIPLRATLVDAAATFSAISTGGSLGREGPLLQVGAAAGSALAPRAGTETAADARRTLIIAGTAAGFAAAYNTPIAAVVFVIEVVAGRATPELLVPALAATTVATVISRIALGGGPLYGLRSFALQSPLELAAYGLLGLAAGLAGPAFMALLDGGRRLFRAIPAPAVARGALGGLLVGACALRFPEVAGNGYEVIQRMLDAQYGPTLLALLMGVKALGTTASVASGSPGGVFTPSLFLGGALGGIIGALAQAVGHMPHAAGGYVLVGMATMIAATTHAPVMAAVLAFELSGDYAVVLPLFVATTVATAVSRQLRSASIYVIYRTPRSSP